MPSEQELARHVVVVGHGMVGHRFVEATAGARHRRRLADHRAGRGGRRRLRPRRAHRLHRALGPRPARAPRQRLPRRRPRRAAAGQPASPRSTAPPRPWSRADGERVGYDALVLATGSYAFVPPVPGHDLPSLPRLPHARRPRRDPRRRDARARRRPRPRGRGDRRWPAGSGSRQRAAPVRPAGPRRRDGAAADGPAARRGRRRAVRPDDRRPGHRRARRASAPTPSGRHNAIGRSGGPQRTTRCG